MSAIINNPTIATFLCGAAITRGAVVKPGADRAHVLMSAAATSKNFGIANNATTTAEDNVEVCVAGGAKGLAAGTISFGDLVTCDSSGGLVATTSGNDRYVGIAMEDAVASDLFSVLVAPGNV